LKKYAFLPHEWTEHPIAIVGLSYMLFRQIHLLVDAVQEQIEKPTLWSYLNYQLNFLTLLSGPIERYQEFRTDWDAAVPVIDDAGELIRAYQRLFIGIIKVSLVASACLAWYDTALAKLDSAALGEIPMTRLFGVRFAVLAFYAFPAYVYFNFS